MNGIVRPLWDERVTIRGVRQADDVIYMAQIDRDESGSP